MSITIPSRDLSPEKRETYLKHVIDAGYQRALNKFLVQTRNHLTIRDLRPEDFGLKQWQTSPIRHSNNTTWIQHVSGRIIVVYKFLQLSLSPCVSQLSFYRDHTCLGIHDLSSCYGGLPIIKNLKEALLDPVAREVLSRLAGSDIIRPELGAPLEGYFSVPYIYDPQDRIEIYIAGLESSTGDSLVLGGFVIEPKGFTIV